jgi:hypothetical protein
MFRQGKNYYFQNPKFVLKQFGAILQNTQKISEKKRRMKMRKRIKGSGDQNQPAAESSPRPVSFPSRTVTFSSPIGR